MKKFHTIVTLLAIITISASVVLFFVSEVDRTFGFDVFPQAVERLLRLVSPLFGVVGAGAGGLSVVVSLFRMSERD